MLSIAHACRGVTWPVGSRSTRLLWYRRTSVLHCRSIDQKSITASTTSSTCDDTARPSLASLIWCRFTQYRYINLELCNIDLLNWKYCHTGYPRLRACSHHFACFSMFFLFSVLNRRTDARARSVMRLIKTSAHEAFCCYEAASKLAAVSLSHCMAVLQSRSVMNDGTHQQQPACLPG